MHLSCDLHIHTALSPCSGEDMTPGNIVGMASLKGLDVIAITDHQRCGNVRPAMKIAEGFGITVIPGMELETSEEIHFICLFPSIDEATTFETAVRIRMPSIRNREDIFGEEWLYNEKDEKIRKEEDLLLVASSIPYKEAFEMVDRLGGVCYPAHADRDSFSILSTLGAIPEEYHSLNLEITAGCDEKTFLSNHPGLKSFHLIRSSDAHSLDAILEPGMMVEIAQFTPTEDRISLVINTLRHYSRSDIICSQELERRWTV